MKKQLAIALAAGSIGLMAAGGLAAGQASGTASLFDGSNEINWAAYGGTYGEQHFSPLTQINSDSVDKLGLAWKIDLPLGNSVSEPLEIDGTLYYVTGYGVVHAADARTGRVHWTFDPKTWQKAGRKLGVGWGSRGIAWWNGKVYVGTQDGRLIAIDGKTGKQVWSQMTVEPNDYNYITGAPRVFAGKVIIGFGGADVGHSRGYVSTYDAETGKLLWRWYVVPGNPAKGFENKAMAMAAKTWNGQWWKYGGGGTVWNSFTYDAETNTIFFGTGNGDVWNRRVRSPEGGDNLFTTSIVALDATTGRYKWHFQMNPGDTWDYDANMDLDLATLMIDGKPRKVIMQAPKNGFFYVIDRITGKLLSVEPFAKVTWASGIDLKTGRPVENPAARFANGTSFELWPSTTGAHSWYPMAYSPKTKFVYIPVLERSSKMEDYGVENDEWEKLQPLGTGQTAAMATYSSSTEGLENTSRLEAWDPTNQKKAWAQSTVGNMNGGIVATGGNLVFQGQLDGHFNAYDATSGKLLWSFDAEAPVVAPPITYSVGGKQYVTVQTGFSTAGSMSGEMLAKFHIDYRTQARRVLTFALGGTEMLPPRQTVTMTPVDDPDYKPDEALAATGARIFGGRCTQCHGIDAEPGGAAPDLRTSPVPLSADAFRSVVKEGALLPNGMPKFYWLSDADLAAIRQYIRSRTAAWRTEREHASK